MVEWASDKFFWSEVVWGLAVTSDDFIDGPFDRDLLGAGGWSSSPGT